MSWKMFSIEVLFVTVLVLSIKYNAVCTEPIIEQGPACESKLRLSCSSRISSSKGLWKFYRNHSNTIENIAKIIYNDNECTVRTIYPIECRCIQGYAVNCIVSNSTVGNTTESWHCSKFSGESTNFSAEIRLVPQDMLECTTTIDPEKFTEDGKTLTTVLNINTEFMTNTQAAENRSITSGPYAKQNETTATEGSFNKHDNIRLIIFVAGPFVVFDIGLVVFVYRKKLCSYFKRYHGNHAVILTNINVNNAAEGNANVEVDINNVAHSNWNLGNSTHTRRIDVTDVQRQCALQLIGKAHENIEICLDDDPLYSRVKDNITRSLRCPETDTPRGAANGPADFNFDISFDDDPLYSSVVEKISTYKDDKGACGNTEQVEATNGPANFNFDILLDDDPLYSSVSEKISTHEDDKGACGYTEQVRTQILTDQLNPDKRNDYHNRASENDDNTPNKHMYTDNQLYRTINNVRTFATDDPLNSKFGKDNIGAPSNTANKQYSVENDDILFVMNTNDDTPHNRLRIGYNDDTPNSDSAKSNPAFSVCKKGAALNTYVGSSDASIGIDDSLFSVDGMERSIDMHAYERNSSFPQTPMCSTTKVSTDGKVIKKNKHVVGSISDDISLIASRTIPENYIYSVVKKTKQYQSDGVEDSTTEHNL